MIESVGESEEGQGSGTALKPVDSEAASHRALSTVLAKLPVSEFHAGVDLFRRPISFLTFIMQQVVTVDIAMCIQHGTR